MAHFPPRATYNAEAKVEDILECVKEHKDKDRSRRSLLVYGVGDGGGGPTQDMLKGLSLLKDVDGLQARIHHEDPVKFYQDLEQRDGQKLLTWNGELYLEFHRGTFTSQAKTKQHNRKCEIMLRAAEMLLVATSKKGANNALNNAIREAWKLVLLNQFHDVLPGSSIGKVYKDALQLYGQAEQKAAQVIDDCLSHAAESMVDFVDLSISAKKSTLVFNPLPYTCSKMVSNNIAVRDIEPFSFKVVSLETQSESKLKLFKDANEYVMKNKWIAAKFDSNGRLCSLTDGKGRESLDGPVEVKMFEDIPVFWDAWDVEVYYQEKGWTVDAQDVQVAVHEDNGDCVSIKREIQLSEKSKMTQIIRMYEFSPVLEFECTVDWRENRRLLRVQVPVVIKHATFATYEAQYGLVQRPTHQNTSWDVAKFECCGQRFVNVSEAKFGVALMSDSKYGYSARMQQADNRMLLGMSLLRAPKAPDLECDMGVHRFKYGVLVHEDETLREVVKQAAIFNTPLVWRHVDSCASLMKQPSQLFEVTEHTLLLDAVKPAEDGQGVVLRFYEPVGSRGSAKVKVNLPNLHKAYLCNGLEEDRKEIAFTAGQLELPYLPFQIITVYLATL